MNKTEKPSTSEKFAGETEKGAVTIFAQRPKQPSSAVLEISQARLVKILIVQKEIAETTLELETLLTGLSADLMRGTQIEPGLHHASLKKIFQVGSDMVPELVTKLIVS